MWNSFVDALKLSISKKSYVLIQMMRSLYGMKLLSKGSSIRAWSKSFWFSLFLGLFQPPHHDSEVARSSCIFYHFFSFYQSYECIGRSAIQGINWQWPYEGIQRSEMELISCFPSISLREQYRPRIIEHVHILVMGADPFISEKSREFYCTL